MNTYDVKIKVGGKHASARTVFADSTQHAVDKLTADGHVVIRVAKVVAFTRHTTEFIVSE